MSKKGKRIVVTLSEVRENHLEAIMKWDGETNRSGAIGRYITEVYKNRQERESKRPVGRPAKKRAVDIDDEPAIYEHPDQMMNEGVKLTRSGILAYYQLRNEKVPDELQEMLDNEE